MSRGEINHRERAKQLRSFFGLRYGNITPTDIDGIIEYKNKAYVIIELKFGAVEIPYGQMLALERLCDDLQLQKGTILIISRHDTPVHEDIDVSVCLVEKYRYKKEWHIGNGNTKDLINNFLNKVDKGILK